MAIEIHLTSREGNIRVLSGDEGLTLMEVIRDSGIDEMLALCGGCCSCATCHVHVGHDYVELLQPLSSDEDDLLDSSDHRNATSRLSCQIRLTQELSGLHVRIAEED